MLSDKKAELERRMATLLAERDQLNAALEDANERILLLERTTREQEMQVLPPRTISPIFIFESIVVYLTLRLLSVTAATEPS